jgi:hypothetical protein
LRARASARAFYPVQQPEAMERERERERSLLIWREREREREVY